jgi:hypothetical protein
MYVFLFGIPVCLLISIIFFFLSSMFSYEVNVSNGIDDLDKPVITGELY